jgi:hypothetical protein
MPPAGGDPPELLCSRCSKPLTAGTATQIGGRPVHIRCLARETQLAAVEQLDAASQARERAKALVERATELVARARVPSRTCSACDRPLTAGGGVLFQGDVLVHALCWRPPDPDRQKPDPPSSRS